MANNVFSKLFSGNKKDMPETTTQAEATTQPTAQDAMANVGVPSTVTEKPTVTETVPATETSKESAAEPATWRTRIASGTASDDDMETGYSEWKAGRYTPGPKTMAAFEDMSTQKEAIHDPTIEQTTEEQVDEGQTISDEIQEKAFNEDGTVNKDNADSITQAATKALGVNVNLEDGTISVEDFKAPSMWESADKWGKASIVLTALSALATALSFGRIPPINFMALSGAKEKWIEESQQALKNYNEVVAPQLKQASEAFGKNLSESIRSQQDAKVAQRAAEIEGIASTAHEKAMTEVNKVNWNNQAEANAYLEKAKANLQASLKLVDRETQAQLISLQQEYAQQMAQLTADLQVARDSNNNKLQQELMAKASDLQATLQTRTAEAMSEAVAAGKINQRNVSKVVNGLNGVSAVSQALGTANQLTQIGIGVQETMNSTLDSFAGALGAAAPFMVP